MSKQTIDEIKTKVKNNEVLTDDEYKELIEQKERESLNSDERIRQTSENQIVKYYFIAGVILGAGLLFVLLEIMGAIKW